MHNVVAHIINLYSASLIIRSPAGQQGWPYPTHGLSSQNSVQTNQEVVTRAEEQSSSEHCLHQLNSAATVEAKHPMFSYNCCQSLQQACPPKLSRCFVLTFL